MSDESGIFHPGNHEAEMCYGGEADLHKHVAECKKNPGHEGLIPLKDVNKMRLPSRYHDDDLIKSHDRPTDLACCESQKKNKMIYQPGVFCPGNHEAEMCYGGEAGLHKHVTGCKKNPGHKGFIPLKDFNTSCLPSRFHDDDLMSETIKALADLTVQVKTKFTSLERPEFYPGTQVPYPCYNDRGSHVIRLGTGRVWDVNKYTESDDEETCGCAKCQVSATPSKVWGEVLVLTATHVVFDDSEARQTRCVLGFDDSKSPVVSLDGWGVRGRPDIGRDRCLLSYVTCDLELVDELDKMFERFEDLCRKVRDKYRRFVDVDKLTVIVSHPHGCPKQVSVGQWTHKRERDDERYTWTRYWYTTCTCPGSSGACVYRPEYGRWLLCHHPHSGSNSDGNYSGEFLW